MYIADTFNVGFVGWKLLLGNKQWNLRVSFSRCSHKCNRDRHTHAEEQVIGQTRKRAFDPFWRPPA